MDAINLLNGLMATFPSYYLCTEEQRRSRVKLHAVIYYLSTGKRTTAKVRSYLGV